MECDLLRCCMGEATRFKEKSSMIRHSHPNSRESTSSTSVYLGALTSSIFTTPGKDLSLFLATKLADIFQVQQPHFYIDCLVLALRERCFKLSDIGRIDRNWQQYMLLPPSIIVTSGVEMSKLITKLI